MAKYAVTPSKLSGEISIPSSKSQTIRAILFAMLASGKSIIRNYLHSPDTDAMLEVCRKFSVRPWVYHDHIELVGTYGQLCPASDIINVGNSGLVLRFVSAIAANSKHPTVLTGDDSIRNQRPMRPLLEGLNQLGAKAIALRGNGFAPVLIQGPITAGKAALSGEDSQPISALLAAAIFAKGTTELKVHNAGERPWVGLTLDWLKRLGVPYENENFERYRVQGIEGYPGFDYTVAGDLSTLAFPLVAALITRSEIKINHVDIEDPQGDKAVIPLLQRMGANLKFDPITSTLHVYDSPDLRGCTIDCNDFIDALPILAVLGCYAQGETRLTNAHIARHKECNRIFAMVNELKQMGADIEETEDGLVVRKSQLKGAHMQTYHDHRVAMALTVAALGAHKYSIIDGVDCVAKTYANFPEAMQNLGAKLSLEF